MTTYITMMHGEDIYYFIRSIDSRAVDVAYISRDHDTDRISVDYFTLSPSGWESSTMALLSRPATSKQMQDLIMRAL